MDHPVRIICFASKGIDLAEKLAEKLPAGLYYKFDTASMAEEIPQVFTEVRLPLAEWASEAFREGTPIIFIGAAGIAVRAIAPSVKNKLEDIPVLVMDIEGRYVIPILSGHYGGANMLAERISGFTGALPVITTGTDITGGFAADVFARQNRMAICDPDTLPRISGKAVAGERLKYKAELPVPLAWKEKLPSGLIRAEDGEAYDICITGKRNPGAEGVLQLIPRFLHIGIGCRKDTDPEKLESFVYNCMRCLRLDPLCIADISSIDLKKDEKALLILAGKLKRPFITYTAEELSLTEGTFHESAFVKETVGVGNVSGRAAARSAGKGFRMLQDTVKEEGMTFAAALPEAVKVTWNM